MSNAAEIISKHLSSTRDLALLHIGLVNALADGRVSFAEGCDVLDVLETGAKEILEETYGLSGDALRDAAETVLDDTLNQIDAVKKCDCPLCSGFIVLRTPGGDTFL